MQKIFEKMGCHSDESSPRPLEWISRNEAYPSSRLSESTGILEPKQIFSKHSEKFGPYGQGFL